MKSIEFKIIVSVVLFTIFIIGLERYQLSKSITEQFISSKKSKNDLLVNTVTPVLMLNFSLGLEGANRDYLEQIVMQNSDLEYMRLADVNNHLIYEYQAPAMEKPEDCDGYNHLVKEIRDDLTHESLATLELRFSNKEYEKMRQTNREITIHITAITISLLLLFVLFMKHLFRSLSHLRDSVLAYDPKQNNFPLELSNRDDEVSLIRNAIIAMVKKIALYTEVLDKTNAVLEEKVRQRTEELEASNAELKLLASVDPLTTLYNRRYFTKSSQQIFDLAKRNGSSLCVIMMDIDNFKSINDTYGHQVGDDVIVSVARVIKESIRKSDLACRFGGEEFVILSPETTVDGAYTLAEKIRSSIEKKRLYVENSQTIHVTISMGVAPLKPELDSIIDRVIDRADSAMYEAKNGGKNRTCVRM